MYALPFINNHHPKYRRTGIYDILLNCSFLLLVSPAVPIQVHLLGVTSLSILGALEKFDWLQHFEIVFIYNCAFVLLTLFCVVKNFTPSTRHEIVSSFQSVWQSDLSPGNDFHIKME